MTRAARAARAGRALRGVLALCVIALPAAAQEVGQIKRLEGEVRILREGQPLVAKAGLAVRSRDRIATGANGAIGITTTDNSMISLGPNSYMVVDQYTFNQQTQDGSISVRFLKGTFAVITGLLAKTAPKRVAYHTPLTTIGVRGTEFAVAVELPPELEAEILAK